MASFHFQITFFQSFQFQIKPTKFFIICSRYITFLEINVTHCMSIWDVLQKLKVLFWDNLDKLCFAFLFIFYKQIFFRDVFILTSGSRLFRWGCCGHYSKIQPTICCLYKKEIPKNNKLDQNGSNWIILDQIGSNWTKNLKSNPPSAACTKK